MKVWIGYEVSYDFTDGTYQNLSKIFDCEVKALLWVEENPGDDYNWRTYEEKEVE